MMNAFLDGWDWAMREARAKGEPVYLLKFPTDYGLFPVPAARMYEANLRLRLGDDAQPQWSGRTMHPSFMTPEEG